MNSRGFTVIEIMVALVIFSIVLLPLTTLLVADSKFENKYEQKQVALLVAKNELEKAKRSFKKIADEEYGVTMGGRLWNIELAVEKDERAQLHAGKKGQTQQVSPGGTQTQDQQAAPEPVAIVKQFVTVRVSRANDTNVLADLRVLKETYR